MTLNCDSLLQELQSLEAAAPRPDRYLVAYSGGLDSTVLLHLLATGALPPGIDMLAVHIDHGLHADARAWRAHCERFAASLGVAFRSERVRVAAKNTQGPEAAARDARYQALAGTMRGGDWLLAAHHRDDHAETLLLNLVRGTGPAGLAGIGDLRPFAGGWLVRPMLPYPRAELADYALLHELDWIDDPSNADTRFDRNFLRHEILPRLAARWPQAAKGLQRSSRFAADAAALLDELAAIDCATLGDRYDRLAMDTLRALPVARQRNVLRFAIRQLQLATPSAAQLGQVVDALLSAKDDAEPVVRWPGVEIRRYRKQLYILPAGEPRPAADAARIGVGERIELPPGMGVLTLEAGAAEGLSDATLATGLELRYRQGGEEFRPVGQSHTRQLKKLLQEAGIVPWMRDQLPLLYAGGALVAVADLWLAEQACSRPGTAVRWAGRPPIH